MNAPLPPPAFLKKLDQHPVIDLRSAKAFRANALPGAIHLPPRRLREVEALQVELDRRWPGEKRLLCDQNGEMEDVFGKLEGVQYLKGGMAAWQEWQAGELKSGPELLVLGGMTGVGKTELLRGLAEEGEQVLDLEGLAAHSGSAFGNLWNRAQPTNGEFQFRLLEQWRGFEGDKVVWVEEEGAFLGKNTVPQVFVERMQAAPVVMLQLPLEQRLERIVAVYGAAPKEAIMAGIAKLGKRMGIPNSQRARHYFEAGRIHDSFRILLQYYDATYQHRRERSHSGPTFDFAIPPDLHARQLIDFRKAIGF